MTDYVKSTNFTSKDALASGNPLKIIKGTEFDIEFNNLATAVGTKADIISPALSGTPTAPTAAAGNNTTQIATTAFVAASATAVLNLAYPVGSIYINAGVTTNPATLLGFGTWTAFGAGRVMVGLNGSDALFDTLEESGGSKDSAVISHTHTSSTTINDPGHSHSLETGSGGSGGTFATGVNTIYFPTTGSATTGITATTSIGTTGSSGTNANLQPYITVAMWKRTA